MGASGLKGFDYSTYNVYLNEKAKKRNDKKSPEEIKRQEENKILIKHRDELLVYLKDKHPEEFI